MSEALLEVKGLVKRFPVRGHGRTVALTAVDGIDLQVGAGETVALIGESGSGKSTVARCIARLVEPTQGEVRLGGRELGMIAKRGLWRHYGEIQMVFQDPPASLNPRMTVSDTVQEPLSIHTELDKPARIARATELLDQVGLRPVLADRYPRQLSGGECQRVAIARALAVDPKLLLLDEPTASLDVSVRGQILDLLQKLQAERNLGYLFISHDLAVVRHIADRVLVMYVGAVVEEGPAAEVFAAPMHPYTRALLTAAPRPVYGHKVDRLHLRGEIPSPTNLPPGCRLAARCPMAQPACTAAEPEPIFISPAHLVRCPVTAAERSRGTPV